MRNKIVGMLLMLSLSTATVSATTYWAKTYGGDGDEDLSSAEQTLDGGIITAGRTTSFVSGDDFDNMLIMKLDSYGNIEWQKVYGGESTDGAMAISQANDGYIVAGYTNSFGAGGDIWVLKLDENGNIEWQKVYGGDEWDFAFHIQQANDGYIVAGTTHSYGEKGDIWILKLDENGNIEWQKVYGGEENSSEAAFFVQQANDGYIVAGNTNLGEKIWKIFLMKLDKNGNIEWQKVYGGEKDCSFGFLQQTEDGYVMAGMIEQDIFIMKTDENGNIEWQKVYGGEEREAILFASQTKGGYIMAGYTSSFGAGGLDAWILKLDENGNIEWQKVYGGEGLDESRFIYETEDGYIMAGYTSSFGDRIDIWILKLGTNGEIIFDEGSGASVAETYVKSVDTSLVAEEISFSSKDTNAKIINTNVVPKNADCKIVTQAYGESSIFPPSAPRNLRGEAKDGYIELLWDAPANNGGANITAYKIYRRIGTEEMLIATVSDTSYQDKNVTANITYHYRVSAVNAVGEGTKSEEITISLTRKETPGFEIAMIIAVIVLIAYVKKKT